MRVGKWVLSLLSDCLVEVVVLSFGQFVLRSEPDCFDVVDQLPLPNLLGDGLGLGL